MPKGKKRSSRKKSVERVDKAMEYLGSYGGPEEMKTEKSAEDIWKEYDLEKIRNDAVCFMFFDALMNAGEVKAVRTMQACIRKDLGNMDIQVDGKYSSKTVDAINSSDPEELFVSFYARITAYYNAKGITKDWDKTGEKLKDVLNQNDGGNQ